MTDGMRGGRNAAHSNFKLVTLMESPLDIARDLNRKVLLLLGALDRRQSLRIAGCVQFQTLAIHG